jgi:hypothetical protein
MTQQPRDIQVKDIDHLGIVAGIIDQMGWVFLSFQAVHLLIVDGVKQITNLTPERRKILRFLGTEASRYYQLC